MSFNLYLNNDNDVQHKTLLDKEFHTLIILLQKNTFLHLNENCITTIYTYYL